MSDAFEQTESSPAAGHVTAERGAASRRRFLAGVGVAAGATLLPGSGLVQKAFAQEAKPLYAGQPGAGAGGVPTDGAAQFAGIPGRNINEQVLNFALTLEILEADLYRQALNRASGLPLETGLNPDRSAYTRTAANGAFPAAVAEVAYDYLVTFAYVEAQHRKFIREAILGSGGIPVVRNPNGYRFLSLGNTISEVLRAVLPLEEVGVRAYLGALPYMTDLGLATVAAGIYSTEARHSAVLGSLLVYNAGPAPRGGDIAVVANQPSQNTFEYYLTPQQVLAAASAYFL